MEFELILHNRNGLYMKDIKDQERNACRNHPDLQDQVDSKNLVKRYLPKQADVY